MDDEQWLRPIRAFDGVKVFRLDDELATDVLRALRPVDEGHRIVLPALQYLYVPGPVFMRGLSWDSVESFLAQRQLSNHAVQVRHYPQVVQRVGQKKALLVGINYSGHPDRGFRLKWGVSDACEMARFLHESCGFEWSNMQILIDDQRGSLPTKANILAAMRWLVKGAQPGDALFFYFSGHATQVKDLGEDDPDGLVECMCAMDYMGNLSSPDTPGIIVDDDINRIMVQPLPQGCRLTAVLDCCHSGTLLDLPFIYDKRGILKKLPNNPNTIEQKSSPADVISLSACKDGGNAFEVPAEGGALREAFIEYMTSSGSHGTCYDVIRSLLAYMRVSGLRQQPQLSSSHPIDIYQRFTIV
ncbi:caspase domain-containing protein [Lactarius hatsudake]|nr:caspase domain-containing protein [Lactarius hatsudake]